MKWIESTIGEICDVGGGEVKTGPFGSQLHQSDYSTFGTPVVMPKDIIEGDVSEASIARVGPEHVERLSKHKLNEGDIVYGRRGDIGRQALITKATEGWLCGTGCLRVSIGDSAPVIPKFLHLYLRQNDVIAWIANQAVGATMPNLNTSILRSVPVRFPELPSHQKEISEVISTYDALIENNNRRIAILEEMAQSLYREWFVKFRFPGHEQYQMVESPLGMIPEGWEVRSIGELYKTSSGGTPSRKKTEYYGEKHWWVKTKELKDGFVISVDEKISDLGLQKSSAKLFPKHTVVIAMYGATIGRLGVLSESASTNQACCALLQKEDSYSSWFAYLMLYFNRKKLIGLGQGAAQQNISQAVIKAFAVVAPTAELLNIFNSTVEPLFLSIENLSKKNENLKTQRDLLLPKLISGHIDLG